MLLIEDAGRLNPQQVDCKSLFAEAWLSCAQFATGPFFCTPGTSAFAGREVAMAHLKACVAAGIRIGGVNSEGILGQNEYQVLQ